jgi:16S rRNA processing protein RimM
LPKLPTHEGDNDRVLLGEIGAAQGLKGEVRIRSYTAEPAAIAEYGALKDETGRLIEIASVRPGPKGVVARIKGVATREAAEALTGTKLYLPRSRLPERGEDEWYYSDLVGLAAVDLKGEAIGIVVAVLNFGAGDLIEIKPASGRANLLVPFTDAAVPEVDIDSRRIVVVPPKEVADEDPSLG